MSPAGPVVTTRRTRDAGASACSTTSALSPPRSQKPSSPNDSSWPKVPSSRNHRKYGGGASRRAPRGVPARGVVGPALAPHVREHREVAQHRDLGRQQPEGGPGGVLSGPQRVLDRGRERGSEQRPAEDRRPHRRPGGPPTRKEHEAERHEVHEVAVADRAPAPVPVVGDQQDVAQPRDHESGEGKPAVSLTRTREQEEKGGRHDAREVRESAPKAAHPEVAEVQPERPPQLRRGPDRRHPHSLLVLVAAGHERAEVIGRHPHAGRVEAHPGIEGIPVVERLALASLVVELPRREPGEAEAAGHHHGDHGAAARRFHDAA